MMAHEVLQGCDVSVWVDGNIQILDDISELVNLVISDGYVGAYEHWGRNNIRDEFIECAKIGFDYAWDLHRQYRRYVNRGFSSNELYETNVLVRRHLCEKVVDFQKNLVERVSVRWEKRSILLYIFCLFVWL